MRLQSNKLKQLGRTIAREQLLKQLDEVDAAGMQNLTWKQGPAWRRKADILADLRRCPNAGIFQVTQLYEIAARGKQRDNCDIIFMGRKTTFFQLIDRWNMWGGSRMK